MGKITDKKKYTSAKTSKQTLFDAFKLMCTAKTLAEKYEANKEVTAKYVHATSRGHEAIQFGWLHTTETIVFFSVSELRRMN